MESNYRAPPASTRRIVMSTNYQHSHLSDFYPAMSHPPAHPAVISATALLGGLRLPPIGEMRILEIGCATGHHILPIAESFPGAKITAIDLDAAAISEAKRLAELAQIDNISFVCADLRDWRPAQESFDLIIAHGVFSWVNDTTKSALLQLCQHALTPQGAALISYNTQPGWALRHPLREMVLSLQKHDLAQGSANEALQWIERSLDNRTDCYARHLLEIIKDTRAKGEQQLKFDDLAPVNDPCYFSQFYDWCHRAGLSYIGEADSTLSPHCLLSASTEAQLQGLAKSPLLLEQMTDFLTERTFRCSVICRTEATRSAASIDEMTSLCIEALTPLPSTGNTKTDAFVHAITTAGSSCLSVQKLMQNASPLTEREALSITMRLLQLGMIRLRSVPVIIADEMPVSPRLSALNLDHIAHDKPMVDAFHRPCALSPSDRIFLRLCDGSMSFDDLMKNCRNADQVEALHALLAHLHERGFFV